MADKRKLQTEIDRVLKQVSEHSEIFEDTYDKIQTATNSNQKEKFEAELKKEIKKLQKFREQIKSWLNSSDAKSMAKVLGETRKLIENQMERYRDLERDAKTKAYSNEGLDKRSKLDPEEQEKQDCRDDLNRYIEDIKLQVDMIEAEIETTSNAKRKKKTEEVLEALQARIERHQRLVAKIEMVIRGLDNNNLEPSQLEDVKEGIEYHINDNTDPDFVEDEYLFDDIEEHLRAVGAVADITGPTLGVSTLNLGHDDEARPDSDDESKKKKDEKKKKTTKKKKSKEKDTKDETKKSRAASESHLEPEPEAAAAASPVVSRVESAPAATKTPTTPAPASPPPSKWGKPVNFAKIASKGTESAGAAAAATVATAQAPLTPRSLQSTPPSMPSTPSAASIAYSGAALPELHEEVASPATAAQSLLDGTHPLMAESGASQRGSSGATPDAGFNFPATAAFPSTSAPLPDTVQARAKMLEVSHRFKPESAAEGKPSASYTPRHPFPTPPYYPTQPLSLFNEPRIYSQLDTNTLFFIFYYQQGTRQQYLAAQELKKQSWRYHKRFQTWFQRHEKPLEINTEREVGSYLYFDFESSWCQRKRDKFVFEYRYLEDESQMPQVSPGPVA